MQLDALTSAFAASGVVAVLLVFLFHFTAYPNVPGPPLGDYLPGGLAYLLYRDPSTVHRTLVALGRRHGDVFQLWVGFYHFLVSSVPGDIAHIMASTEDFDRPPNMKVVLRSVIPGGLMTMQPHEHMQTRRKLRSGFCATHFASVHHHLVRAVKEANHLISLTASDKSDKSPLPAGCVDISKVMYRLTLRIITNVAFGVQMSLNELDDFAEATDILVDELLRDLFGYPLRQLLTPVGVRRRLFASKAKIEGDCRRFIAARMRQNRDGRLAREPDLLDAILSLGDSNMQTAVSHLITYAVGGAHTTGSTLAWAIFELSQEKHSHIVRRVQTEVDSLSANIASTECMPFVTVSKLEYVRKVWKETLRLHPTGSGVQRVATHDVVLQGSGVLVKRGTPVLALSGASHIDSKYWGDGDVFRPERWGTLNFPEQADLHPSGTYTPFSAGTRNCAGQKFAGYKGVFILAELFRRFTFSLACDASEVHALSAWVEVGKVSTKKNGVYDAGIPVRVALRSTW